jgi:hypothetical protein
LVSIADLPSMSLRIESGTSDVLTITIEGTGYLASFPSVWV